MVTTLTTAQPLSDVSPTLLFGQVNDQAWRWLHLEAREQCPFLRDYLPSLPPEALQAGIATCSGDVALAQGFEAYELFKRLLGEHGRPLKASDAVLDFGCGWGRIIRYFVRDVEPENLWGIDINDAAIEACRETNRWARFEQINPFPPSRFEDGTFDLIYAFSVFSHLSEECHLAWLEEFERILKPEGVFISTTLPRHFIEKAGEYAREDPESLAEWKKHAAESFSPPDEFLAVYDRGEYCFAPISGAGEHFGFACISRRYMRERWTRHFVLRDRFHWPRLGQTIMVCSKR